MAAADWSAAGRPVAQARPGSTRTNVIRAGPHLLAGALAITVLLRLAWSAGGYFPLGFLTGGLVCFVALALLLIVRRPARTLSLSALVALGALALLTAWSDLSTMWSAAPDSGILATQRDLSYLAIFGLGIYAAGSGRFSRHLVWGVHVAIVVVVGSGLLTRIYPGVLPDSSSTGPFALYRLSYPVTYWNAYGALAAMGGILALGLAGRPRERGVVRGVLASAAVLCLTAMYLSLSRGAWAAMLVGLVALVALGSHRGALVSSALLVAAGTGAVMLLLGGLPALVDDPGAGRGQVSAGQAFGPELLAVLAAVGVLQVGVHVLARRLPVVGDRLPPSVVSRLRIGAAVAVVTVLGIAYAAYQGSPEGGRASGPNAVGSFFTRQYDDFMHAGAFVASGSARLTSAKGTRSDVYRVALAGFSGNPLAGDGAGSFEVRWMQGRHVNEKVVNAHSLYLETLDELGVIGGISIALFLGAIGAAALRARSRRGPMDRGRAAAAFAAWTVWVAHSAVDWDWQISTLTGFALLLAASLLPEGRRRLTRVTGEQRRGAIGATSGGRGASRGRGAAWVSMRPGALSSSRAGMLAASACALAGGYLGLHLQDERRLAHANDLGAQGHYADALAFAQPISRRPTAGRAALLQASAELALRRPHEASIAFAHAASYAPQDWEIRLGWASALTQEGDRAGARRQFLRARALNPLITPSRRLLTSPRGG